ncbi:MAG: hypothetical protein ABSG32_13765 [Terriglobia bacterium]|jgi:hypothetical protein
MQAVYFSCRYKKFFGAYIEELGITPELKNGLRPGLGKGAREEHARVETGRVLAAADGHAGMPIGIQTNYPAPWRANLARRAEIVQGGVSPCYNFIA